MKYCAFCKGKIDVLEDVYYAHNKKYYCRRHFKQFIEAVETD